MLIILTLSLFLIIIGCLIKIAVILEDENILHAIFDSLFTCFLLLDNNPSFNILIYFKDTNDNKPPIITCPSENEILWARIAQEEADERARNAQNEANGLNIPEVSESDEIPLEDIAYNNNEDPNVTNLRNNVRRITREQIGDEEGAREFVLENNQRFLDAQNELRTYLNNHHGGNFSLLEDELTELNNNNN